MNIHLRGPDIDDRILPGDWGGYIIKGAFNQSSIGVLVEHVSRLMILMKMTDATATSTLAGFAANIDGIADSPTGRLHAVLNRECPLYFYEKMLALQHHAHHAIQ
jgi:hypothetical protein